MARIRDELLDCVIYLYPSKADAEGGKKAGGSGFIAGIESEANPRGWLYAVTNRHVLEDGQSGTIRLNTRDEGVEIIETDLDDWDRANEDDLAVCGPLPSQTTFRLSPVTEDVFVTPEIIERYRIGPSDEVFMVGRFVNHAGQQSNTPSVRFGNVSMMPLEPLKLDSGAMQESFLVEMRSSGGYSGSPVFVYIRPSDVPFRHTKKLACGPWLLGIDCGHLPAWDRVYERDKSAKYDEFWVKRNTGVAAVIPAWRLRELLYTDELVKERKRLDKELKRAHDDSDPTSDDP
jgi:hypothetical protein